MNVVIVGVLDRQGSSNLFQAKAFKKLGYNIIPINYRTIIKEYGIGFFEKLIVDTVKEYKPYLTLFSKCNGINPEVINKCSKHSLTWLWFMDSHIIAERTPEIIENAKRAHLCSCTSEIAVDLFRKNKAFNCELILEGADTDYYKPVEPVDEYKADISFIGSRTDERDKYKSVLENAGYKVKFYGAGYDDGRFRSWPEICSSSKFILSLNTFNNIPGYFSGRVFESLACQACTFHLDNTGTLNRFFEDGKEIVYFSDEQDLLRKLKNIDADIAKEIAINGRNRILKEYTWEHSVSKILGFIKEYKESNKRLQNKAVEGVSCTVCNQDDATYLQSFPLTVIVNNSKKDVSREYVLEMSRCNICGAAFLSKRVVWSIIKDSQSKYIPSSFKDNDEKKKEERRIDAIHQLDLINKYISKPGKMLDIGASAGCFLNAARVRGWDVRGTEISTECIKIAKEHYGIDIFYGDVQEYTESGFDAIVLWNVIEHLYDVHKDMKHLVSLLNKDGIVLIKTPNHTEETLLKYPMLPMHTVNLNPKSINYLFDKIGLEILESIDGMDDMIPTLTIAARKK